MPRDLNSADTSLERRARRRVALKTGFYTHALVFLLVNGGLYLMSLLNGWGEGEGWGHWHRHGLSFPLWGWGLALTIHGIVVFVKLQGDGMRQRMLDREIETLKRREGGGQP